MTGYTRNAIVHHGRLDADINMISKPFSFEELAAKVRQRLDAWIELCHGNGARRGLPGKMAHDHLVCPPPVSP